MTPFEQAAKEKFEKEGWTVLNSGWPDFLLIRGQEVKAVEVKSGTDKIRANQKQVLDVLSRFLPVRTLHEGPGYGDNEKEMHVLVWHPTEEYNR